MTGTALLFPGQGSQRVGMGFDLVERHDDLVRELYRTADDVLGFGLSELCWHGTAEQLRPTEITQPAVFLTSMALLRIAQARGLAADAVAGHSLGEYTALVCAGALDWVDALRLVRRRGELMAEVNSRTPGRMAAVVGLDADRVDELCALAKVGHGLVEVANYNEPGQTVVSGVEAAVHAVVAEAKRSGATKVVLLDVGAPFHCSLMRDVEDEFAAELERVVVRDPVVPIVANVIADYARTAADVLGNLRRQLTGAVRWTETMSRLADAGMTRFVEVGPGRVLTGFVRAALPGSEVLPTGDVRRLERALDSAAVTAV
ncbi:ACP S-malonyltransferase [Saccharothrix sp. NRRL B-16314]|uniref:ACP S-malonyltransferase n=1 Tax=Saccharothrix sp. NRRL B-16314 TaxID=1463825 RepID=UPI0005261B57|nr:ACP S-malonyltransferase [Saccharothrix sp. NRRL B-16314]